MSNKMYDRLKVIALIFVPFSGLITSILGIFDVPHAQEIAAVLAAIDTFLGGLVEVAKIMYERKREAELDEGMRLNGQDQ